MPKPRDREMAAEDREAIRRKALLVHERLCQTYHCPIPYFHSLDPLSELIASSLSHRTRNADSGRAFKELRRRFPEWSAVRDAPTREVEAAIVACTWPELKAPRIQQILGLITERRGALSLDFLGEMSIVDARAWLEALPGVGPKTSAAVLAFSTLRRAALPVDSHHHRVAQRLGLIGPKVDVGPSHAILAAQLPPDWDAQQVCDNHEALMLHGQRCCYHAGPACDRCPVLDQCPFGQRRMGHAAAAPIATPVVLPVVPPASASLPAAAPLPQRPQRRVEKRPGEATLWDAADTSPDPPTSASAEPKVEPAEAGDA